ncbi:hypothetical protein ACOME3_003912 [Neoechinorhynchus agilis]
MDSIWSNKFWLPPNLTWDLFYQQIGPDEAPRPRELYLTVPFISTGIVLLRLLLYQCLKHQSHARILRKSKKISESLWRFTYYLFAYTYGITFLSKKPWFIRLELCWKSYPKHELTHDLRSYYHLQIAFYVSALLMEVLSFDSKRKDSNVMRSHHVITLILLFASYTVNLTRIGAHVLILHDICDIFLESAKLARYFGKQILCNIIFCGFCLTWIITRVFLFSAW